MDLYILIGAFFFIALIYSSVGFGGGSSYLALMAQPFFSLMPDTIRPTALLCNVVVVTGGTIARQTDLERYLAIYCHECSHGVCGWLLETAG